MERKRISYNKKNLGEPGLDVSISDLCSWSVPQSHMPTISNGTAYNMLNSIPYLART